MTVESRTTATRFDWRCVRWNHPSARALRDRMDAELNPRYTEYLATPPQTPAPTEDQIVTVWIGEVDGAPAVTASLRRTPDYLEVKRVFVAPEYRCLGLARLALDHVEETARDLGAESLVLQTGNQQPDAIALYLREGWQRVEPFGPYVGDSISVCFRKVLIREVDVG